MAQSRTPDSEDIAKEILLYLSEHPLAQDTLEGIVQWWLLQQQIQHWTTNIGAALESLVNDGVVLERKGPDGRSYYRLNRRKLKAIRKWLKVVVSVLLILPGGYFE